jgi:putative ABC transport system ATP-binding protein
VTKKMAYIKITDLVKVYRIKNLEVQALRGLSMEVDQGSITTVMGPSGSGKTTLLNILGGLSTPTAGYVNIGGQDLTSMSRDELVGLRQHTVGHIFQTFNLIPNLTAEENVELPLIATHTDKKVRRERVHELLSVVGLADRMHHKPDELSGGEQQRVAIAAALANDPPIILADEPTGELDTKTAQEVVNYLIKIREDYNKTIILVTHDPRVARQTDLIYRIADGRIKAVTSPSQLTETEDQANSQVEYLRARIDETTNELMRIEDQFHKTQITGDEFAQRHRHLIQTKNYLELELQRLGV